jgi:hypothetical protein
MSDIPPCRCGGGNAMVGVAVPKAGLGRNFPIVPSANLVKVVIESPTLVKR